MVLARLNDTEQNELFRFLEEKSLSRGEKLFAPDDVAEGVYFVKSGRLGVQADTGFEGKKQIVAFLDPGSPAGEKGLAGNGRRGMSVIAVEDSVLAYLPATGFAKIEQSNPSLAIKILKELLTTAALRLQANSERLAHVL